MRGTRLRQSCLYDEKQFLGYCTKVTFNSTLVVVDSFDEIRFVDLRMNWLVLFSCLVASSAAAICSHRIFSQDGYGSNGIKCANPVHVTNMTVYSAWPPEITATRRDFFGGVLDNNGSLWLVPGNAGGVVRLNLSTGIMTVCNKWPPGVSGLNIVGAAFEGGAFDGRHVWLVPMTAAGVVRINPATCNMSLFNQWPVGLNRGTEAFCGSVFDGEGIWMVPRDANGTVRIATSTGQMTLYNQWPVGVAAGGFCGGVFDGQYVWLVPARRAAVVRIEPTTGTMTPFDQWPPGLTRGSFAFEGGTFDGSFIWLAPYTANAIVKLHVITGNMWLVELGPDELSGGGAKFTGAVFDGQYVWFVPRGARGLMRIDTKLGNTSRYPATGNSYAGGVFDGKNLWLVPCGSAGAMKVTSSNEISASASAEITSSLSDSSMSASMSGQLSRTYPSVSLSASSTVSSARCTSSNSHPLSSASHIPSSSGSEQVTKSETLSQSLSCPSPLILFRELKVWPGLRLAAAPAQSSELPATMLLADAIGYGGFMVQARGMDGVEVTHVINTTTAVGFVAFASLSTNATARQGANSAVMTLGVRLAGSDVGTLSFEKTFAALCTVTVRARGRCIPPDFVGTAIFEMVFLAFPPRSAVQIGTTAAFQSSIIASSVMGHPLTAMTTTGMTSIMALDACVFSDVDPLDPSVSPVGTAILPTVGQYYRGAAVVGIGLYCLMYASALILALVVMPLMSQYLPLQPQTGLCKRLALLRFPSIGMVVVGMFHQGLVSVGISLIRLSNSGGDVLLGAISLLASCMVVAYSAYATTRGFQCRMRRVNETPRAPRVMRKLLTVAQWTHHWEDWSSTSFKRRHLLLIDDLSRPWWTAVELAAGVAQGAVLGLRENSLSACKSQQWVLLALCSLMFGAACFFRPCGAALSNAFLVMSKLSSLVLTVLIVLQTMTTADTSAAAQSVTTISTAVSSIQTAVQVVVGIVTGWSDVTFFIRRKIWRSLRPQQPSTAAVECAREPTAQGEATETPILQGAQVSNRRRELDWLMREKQKVMHLLLATETCGSGEALREFRLRLLIEAACCNRPIQQK